MGRDLVKKIVIGGAIILSAALPALGQGSKPLKEAEKKPIERVVMLSKSEPFIESKFKLSKREQDFIIGLEELNYRLEKDGLGKDRILDYYSKNRVERQGEIISYFTRSPERKAATKKITYAQYRRNLGLDEKIEAAPGFFEEYQDVLMQASEKHSVPQSIIASIIGVESDFANNRGKYPAFDALASLYTTSKKSFAYNELKELIRYCDRNNRTLDEFTSSYAGAIGWAQFIPSSLNRLFAGKNMDFAADPFDMEDCIHSVAYYLNRSGWDPRREKNVHEGSRNWKALLAYNKSSVYVKAVLELSRSLDNYIRTAAASAKPKPEPDFEF